MVQGHVADMALDDAAALLVHRAAWTKDMGAPATREAAMAKLFATDHAQEDRQGRNGMAATACGAGISSRARIGEIPGAALCEGASDVQKVVIARQTLEERSS